MPEVKRRKRVEQVRLRPPTKGELDADQQRRYREAADRQRAKAIAYNSVQQQHFSGFFRPFMTSRIS